MLCFCKNTMKPWFCPIITFYKMALLKGHVMQNTPSNQLNKHISWKLSALFDSVVGLIECVIWLRTHASIIIFHILYCLWSRTPAFFFIFITSSFCLVDFLSLWARLCVSLSHMQTHIHTHTEQTCSKLTGLHPLPSCPVTQWKINP